jgi:hypothetical protein
MDLIISTEYDFVLNDCKYVFTKKYPYLMIFFKDDEDWEIEDTKLFSEILKKKVQNVNIADDSTIGELIEQFLNSFGVWIDIRGLKDEKLIELPENYSLEKLNNNLFEDGYDEFPRSSLGLRVVKANNSDEKYKLQHLDGEDVIINNENFDKNATNLMLAKDNEGKVYVINAETLEVIKSI